MGGEGAMSRERERKKVRGEEKKIDYLFESNGRSEKHHLVDFLYSRFLLFPCRLFGQDKPSFHL